MSRIDIDDLVASFKGQAVGQEAMDLALLQKQLAQTLRPYNAPKSSGTYPSPIQTSSYHNHYASPQSSYGASSSAASFSTSTSQYTATNTPTASSNQWANGQMYNGSTSYYPHAGTSSPVNMSARSRSASRTRSTTPRARSNSLASGAGAYDSSDWDEMQEVEEDLDGMDAASDYYDSQMQQYYEQQQQPQYAQTSQFRTSSTSPAYTTFQYQQTQSQSSSFASSDPFYLATAAKAAAPSQNPVPTQSSSGNASTNWFAPAVGFAAYAPVGNRWAHPSTASASAVQ